MEERKHGETGEKQDAGFHALVQADISVGSLPFRLTCQYGRETGAVRAEWKGQENGGLGISRLSEAFSESPVAFEVPDAIGSFELALTKIVLTYFFRQGGFEFLMEALPYGSFRIRTEKEGAGTAVIFELELTAKFFFKELPALGSGADPSDYIGLKQFRVEVRPGHRIRAGAKLELMLLKKPEDISVSVEFSGERDASRALGFPSAGVPAAGIPFEKLSASADEIHWIDIGKDAGPLHLSRLGFSMDMGSGSASIYVDAGIRLSVLMLEFMGLSLSLPFKAGKHAGYGLDGLAVTMSKPPLTISGGLYLSGQKEDRVYSGEVMVKFRELGLTALCSYGELGGQTPSLFAFLLLEASLGGPPAFYVTAIAGGFGYNRSIRLPDRAGDAGSFPFVAAAMGKGNLKASMTPAQVLESMNEFIRPQNHQYFVSAGIRFTSFGIAESFALLNLEFGERFELSCLGLSRLSLPTGSGSPMAYLELALKMVLAPDDGVFCVEGALSDASYLLHKNCRPQGGFAFFFWFGKHEHAGDFVITLGGYRSGFSVKHYPKADRIGINWEMGNGLTLTSEFYFALIPSGVMMGGKLGLTYEWGRLKAWLRAWAEFFMQWKPFLYEISVGVSVGASYRWDFFPFYKTFHVELGADLELWGPPFGGKAHISWFLISFTIRFGEGKPSAEPVGWNDFAGTFLKGAESEKARQREQAGTAPRSEKEWALISIQAAGGLLENSGSVADPEAESKEKQEPGLEPYMRLDSGHMRLEVTSRMVCTSVCYGENEISSRKDLGIIPMKIPAFSSVLTAKLVPEDKREEAAGRRLPQPASVKAEPLFQNVPKALWDTRAPSASDTDTLKKQVPVGMAITCEPQAPEGVWPRQGSYDMGILCRNERLKEHVFSYTIPSPITPGKYPKENRFKQIEESIGRTGGERKQILDELSVLCGVWREEEIEVSGWTSSLDEMLYAVPLLEAIGEEGKNETLWGYVSKMYCLL